MNVIELNTVELEYLLIIIIHYVLNFIQQWLTSLININLFLNLNYYYLFWKILYLQKLISKIEYKMFLTKLILLYFLTNLIDRQI